MKKLLIVAICVSAALVSSALYADQQPDKSISAYKPIGPDDDYIVESIQTAIQSDEYVAPYATFVTISSNNAVVTLSGSVTTNAIKTDIEFLTKSTAGVTRVINNIEVKSSPTAP